MANITGTPLNDSVTPTASSPGVTGGPATGGPDVISGLGGNDFIDGGAGGDTLLGDTGDDVLRGGAGSDSIVGGTGFDLVSYFGDGSPINGTVAYNGSAGHNVTVTSAEGTDTLREIEAITGSAGGDLIQVTSADNVSAFRFLGLGGNDTLIGTADRSFSVQADYRATGMTSGVVVDLATGIVSNDGFGGQDSLVNIGMVRGSDLDDSLFGSASADRFRGRGGNDWMDGRGGTGDQLDYTQSTAAVSVNLVTQRAQDGEGGIDTVIGFEDVRATNFDDTIIGSAESEFFGAFAGNDLIIGGGGQDRVGFGFSQGNASAPTQGAIIDLVTGIAQDGAGGTDTLLGIANVNGTNFADSILGGATNNRFRGEAGNDTLDGGTGSDYAEYTSATTGATVDLTAGTAQDGLGGTDLLISIENAIGSSHADRLTGVAQLGRTTSMLRGGGGNDTLVGINGEFVLADYADQTTGLSINLATGTANDGRGGTDTLLNIRGLNMFGTFADTLAGTAADEWFNPSLGADSVNAGMGFDIVGYIGGDAAGVTVNLFTGRARDAGGAIDTILGFEGISASFSDDILIGNGQGNLIGPGAGADSVNGANGQDTVSYSLGISPGGTQYGINEAGDRAPIQGVTVDLFTMRATDYAGDIDTLTSIEHAIGSTANDILRGNGLGNHLGGAEGNDTIDGRAGNDTLDGGLGDDRMTGGGGDDSYIVDAAGDLAIEALNQGIDSVFTGIATYVLRANVENLIATSAANHGFTGNGLGNRIVGGAGADTINGAAGNDTIDGGAGIDRLLGGVGNDLFIVTEGDTVIEGLNWGNDTVQAMSGAVTLANHVETLVLAGTATNGTGNTLANTIIGNGAGNTIRGMAGNDTIDGGNGIDILIGGAGQDFLTGGGANDRFRLTATSESTLAAPDVILDFNQATQFDRIELNLIDANTLLAGNQAFTYRGTAFTGAAGDLRVVATANANEYLAAGDVNGDGTADFAILIQSLSAPASTWFVL